ncbi:MAG: N-acetyltransferase [Proteobacteria bacterium]|nr:N-acetyltransferase [Pseudomonadota bacterium]
MADLSVRRETAGDSPAIHQLTKRAFATQPHAGGDEQDLVDRLRTRGELTLSLVAVLPASGLVGHVGFSPVTVDDADLGWFQLAPLSVEPDLHRRGIGAALVAAGIAALGQIGARGIGVVGDPAYYERFGFTAIEGLGPDGPEARFFRALTLGPPTPKGRVRYASAFG